MTTIAFDRTTSFSESISTGETLLEKSGKLLSRINSTLMEAVHQESVEKEVDFQFDRVMRSLNEQLKKAEDGSIKVRNRLRETNLVLIRYINKPEKKKVALLADLPPFCSFLITATKLVFTQLKSAQDNIRVSKIDRACVGECSEILVRLETLYLDICALLEDIAMHAQIFDALLDASLTKSINPELNDLLG